MVGELPERKGDENTGKGYKIGVESRMPQVSLLAPILFSYT